MASQPIIQWNYIIYCHIIGSVFNNIQGLFILTIGYVNMTTYPLTKNYYIIERVYFIIGCLYYLSVHCHSSWFFYTVLKRYKRDYLHASIDILFYIMFYVVNTMKKH